MSFVGIAIVLRPYGAGRGGVVTDLETQMPGASSGRCWSLSSLGCIVSGRQYRSARAVPEKPA